MESGVNKIYLFDYGWLAGEMGWFMPNPGIYPECKEAKVPEWVDIPVSGALIEHDHGLLVVDAGSPPDAEKVWGEGLWSVFPMTKFTDENRLENQIALAGYKPEDVNYLLFTHLHLDHTGQAPVLNNATMVVHKKELLNALYLTWIGKPGAYIPGDLEALKGPNLFTFSEDQFEVLPGVNMIWGGGHTPGSCLIQVTTKKGNSYILTGDIVHLGAEMEAEAKGWLLGDAEEYNACLKKLKMRLRLPNTKLVIGHDPKLWDEHPKAPKYLD